MFFSGMIKTFDNVAACILWAVGAKVSSIKAIKNFSSSFAKPGMTLMLKREKENLSFFLLRLSLSFLFKKSHSSFSKAALSNVINQNL